MKIYGNSKALSRLETFMQSGRFPHGILLVGDKGTGRGTLADYAAMLLMCEKGGKKPCGVCDGCSRIERHIHPDVIYVDCAQMKVTELREIVASGTVKPNDGNKRVFVFREFHLLRTECQNVLLTFFEEPLEFNRYILTSSAPNLILTTILSRVTMLRTFPLSVSECENALAERKISPELASKLSLLFGGNLGRALSAAENAEETAIYETANSYMNALCKRDEYQALLILSKLKTRDELKVIIGETSDIINKALVQRYGGDRGDLAANFAKGFPLQKLTDAANLLERYQTACELNFNVALFANTFTAELFGVL